MLIGYIRPSNRWSESRQREAIDAAGVERVWIESRDETLADMIRQLRRGDVVAVWRLALLAEPTADRRDPQRRVVMVQRLQEIEARGASVRELHSGRSSAVAADRDAMILDGADDLSGRGPRAKSNNPAGRPPVDWEPWRPVLEREWYSLQHDTNAEALAAMQAEGVPVKSVFQVFSIMRKLTGRGASGRAR